MLKLHSRHRLDISFRDFAYALFVCAFARDAQQLSAGLAATWSSSGNGLACRSVRSGFHLLLDALDLRAGDEVLVSAVTHPDMVRIVEAHGLVAVPVDLDVATLAPRLEFAERLVTPRTQAILIAHLFGGHVDLAPFATFAKRHRLQLWEDCAQAFSSPDDTGDAAADASMFSFGALKTCTALGGALLKVKDPLLLGRMRAIQAQWPVQARRAYGANVLKFLAFNVATKPTVYGLLAWIQRVLGRDFDRLVNSSVRAFRPRGLLPQLEVQPSSPLLATLAFRLRTFDDARIRRRTASGDWLVANLPVHIQAPGSAIHGRSHWLFPILTSRADQLIAECRRAGFDAARGASSVCAAPAPAGRPESEPITAQRMMACLVFLPAYPELPKGSLARIVAAARARTPLVDGGQTTSTSGVPAPLAREPLKAQRACAWDRLAGGTFDLLVIGAGIIGSRVAYEAAGAGLKVALVDAGDFGGATSSGSSKLIHGGFRYLPMGDLALVWESQRERKALLGSVAPNLVRRMPMLLAAYRGGSKGPAMASAGVLAYGALCGFRGTGVALMGARGAQRLVPSLRTDGLSVCGLFDEGQTNDSRLVLATVAGAVDNGATAVNHARVIDLAFGQAHIGRATIVGDPDGDVAEVEFKNVVNAAGPWVDKIRRLEEPACAPMARLSKGVHVLLEPEAEWQAGLAVPVEDGRVAMAIPWQGMLMLGTTDTHYVGDPADCCVSPADIAQVLDEASVPLPGYMLRRDAVRFSFAGLRVLPLGDGSTANARREHLVQTGRHGMVSIAGGKLTTHRRIALDVVHRLREPRLSALRLVNKKLPQAGGGRIELVDPVGAGIDPDVVRHVTGIYGGDSLEVLGQRRLHANALERIHPRGPDVWAQAYHAVDREWASTVEDVVRRRTTIAVRGLATAEVREAVARILAASRRALRR